MHGSKPLGSIFSPRGSRAVKDRRHFLRLAATGLMGGLVLRLDREARGAVTTTPRFVLYNHGNGLQKVHLDKTQLQTPDSFQLASFMKHFEPFQSELTVAQNLYCTRGEYLHGNASSALSCTERGAELSIEGVTDLVVGGVTIDQLIANELSKDSRLRSVVLGHPFDVSFGNCAQGTILGRARKEPVYPTLDPVKAHEQIFGVGNQDEVLVQLEKSYLDFLKDDIQTFQSELPVLEKQKLEQYLESVREIERALAGGVAGACPAIAPQEFTQGEAKDFQGHTQGSNNPAFWRYMCDLGVAALQCGATRQVTMLHTYACVHMMYEFDGVARNHHQDIGHGDEEGTFCEKILGFHAEQVAYMYQKLKQIPEGAGTMADSLLMAWLSDGGGYHHGGTQAHSMIWLGKGNGRLKTGQWRRFVEGVGPNFAEHALGRAHITTAQALGLELNEFGDGVDPCTGPLPGLLT